MKKRFGFTYLFCTDLNKMKHFYRNILGLNLIWEDEEAIAFKIGDHQLAIFSHKDFVPLKSQFSIQPGWEGGSLPATSWSLECDPEDFLTIYQAVREDQTIRSWSPKPTWVGYWSFPLLDPMNHTIEITCPEKEILL
jgi:catechol 2,3-dioxygenase-like lactoylglutathione lyase family enzyme